MTRMERVIRRSKANAKNPAYQAKRRRRAERKARLSAPIRPDRIATFVKHLIAVSFGAGSECWFYVGCGKSTTLPEELKIKTTGYANLKFNGETVGPHQFALCAAEGLTLAELAGFDVHHAAEFGRCFGYHCCNPDHLQKVPSPEHRSSRGDCGSLIRFQTRTIREVTGVPVNQRRPVEHLTLTGAGTRRRFLGGTPFLIRGGVIEGLEGLDGASIETTVLPTTEV